jgi:hypothetical protein
MLSRIDWRRGPGCVYARCPLCLERVYAQTDGSPNGNQRAKDKVGEGLASHANDKHLPEEPEYITSDGEPTDPEEGE